ncbi:MAG: MgtC/SapB family protein, partial [Pseudolabrys sp.]|nr:MgtC/SapB family protein [Pseudolabrys sp.]
MNVDHLLYRLALALGIGLLVGLERGWKTRDMQPGTRAAGVRTFTLCGLLGGIVAALAQAMDSPVGGGLVLGFGFAVYAAIFAILQRDADRAGGSYSATTIVAGLLTFMLGAYAVIGDMRIAAAVAVAATGVLAIRSEIHGWIKRITWPELRSALVLLAMTCIILPIVPDMTIGGANGVNPREVWLIAIVLAGVSFLGYVAVKALGSERGILFGAIAGGLVSSTAVTVTSARRAVSGDARPALLAAGVALATAVSFLRVIAIAAALQPSLLPLTAPAL